MDAYEIFLKKHEYFQEAIMSAFRIKYEDIEELEFLCVEYGKLSYTEVQEMPFYKLSRWLKKVEANNKKKREEEEKESAKYNMKDYNPNSMMKNAQKQSNFKQPKMPKYK
ncbi:MAG: hypothetical protein FWC41_04440 [Firmicutes bacterium]|nr:hypothetical protein [Bacillota bacterium]